VENGKLGLEEDVAVNRKGEPIAALHAAEAHRGVVEGSRVDRGVVHVLPADDGFVVADVESEIRERGVAGEDVAADVPVVYSTGDLGVVSVGDVFGDHEEGCPGVGDGFMGDISGDVADGEGVGLELPEAAGAVDIDEVQVAVEFGGVDKAKVVISRCSVLERSSRRGKGEEMAYIHPFSGWQKTTAWPEMTWRWRRRSSPCLASPG
jgi:hypothetical protein